MQKKRWSASIAYYQGYYRNYRLFLYNKKSIFTSGKVCDIINIQGMELAFAGKVLS